MYVILRVDLGKDLLLWIAIYGNKVSAVCVDNWSQFGNVREEFCNNAERCTNEDTQLELHEGDFRDVEYDNIGKHNVYFLMVLMKNKISMMVLL